MYSFLTWNLTKRIESGLSSRPHGPSEVAGISQRELKDKESSTSICNRNRRISQRELKVYPWEVELLETERNLTKRIESSCVVYICFYSSCQGISQRELKVSCLADVKDGIGIKNLTKRIERAVRGRLPPQDLIESHKEN